MLKKKLAAVAVGTALAAPLAAAGPASAATPVYHHVIAVTATSYIYWDRDWPAPNRAVAKTQYDTKWFSSNDSWPGSNRAFYLTAALPGNSYLDGVHEEAMVATKEIAKSGGAVNVTFDNWLSYGSCGAANGCWSNHQAAHFKIGANGTYYYTLVNDNGDGSWGETDIVVHNFIN